MSVYVPIYPGSSSFFPGDTPFGFYDYEIKFQEDADKVVDFVATRLGYPINDVELQADNIYTCFEEAITEYGNQINTFNARDNLINVLGLSTGSSFTGRLLDNSFEGIFHIASTYGTEAEAEGTLKLYTGSIAITAGKQVYDLIDPAVVTLETGSVAADVFEIREIFHQNPPAIVKYFDPFVGTGLGSQQLLDTFGWGNYSPGVSYLLMPLYADVLRLQGIEFNDMIRKSAYGFQLSNTRFRIFPVPTYDFTVYFNYYLKSEKRNVLRRGPGLVSDASNIPYGNLKYTLINDIGKQWIRKYTLALCKEVLGLIRGKYSSLPIPNSEITLNGADLVSQGATEKEALITELRETLDSMSKQAQLERKQAEAEALQNQMVKMPLFIYTG